MKIGIDCRTILNPETGERAGVGTYTHNLVRTLLKIDESNRYTLFFNEDFPSADEFRQDNSEVVGIPQRVHRKIPVYDAHYRLARLFTKQNLDVLHGPAYIFPLRYKGKTVITVHDLAIYQQPDWFPAGQWYARKIVVPRCIRLATRIITVSESTREDLLKQFHVPYKKVQTVYEGVEERKEGWSDGEVGAVFARFAVRRPYFLFVGTIEPRKNIERIIAAFERFVRKEGTGHQLVIAGTEGWHHERIFDAIENSVVAKQIRYIGYVTAEEKSMLLSRAHAFLFPSLYEGFGLPVLEAMNAYVPVVTSEVSSTREIAGDAAILVDPYQVDEIAKAMTDISGDERLRAMLREAGERRVELFSWERCAEETLEVYEEVVGS